ncbi:SLC13 family permease [Zobellella taiwanensis]|jgi:sodium-dependent dicarboxylate transporter 2/3/5|uniref:Dihydroorotate dehydrogenase n=1 Tax=Zobellella taiwanensis TaxID=347535 RepID=A0A2P7QL63_9GAMM|nr:SLC13 family permease [Zobellella taiwanensis]PSJ38708.1 dihydroorotate dehydrogenase [Zobellella taiwanensis]
MAGRIKLLLALLPPLLVLNLPVQWLPLPDPTLIEQRLLAIFLLAALLWVLEPVPVFATSLLIIGLLLVMTSDQAAVWFLADAPGQPLGEPLSYQAILGSFASPIIILFLGGFALALAAAKYQLDTNLANTLLRPFMASHDRLMLGVMLITALFSMFMSNTATTLMMLTIMGPVFASLGLQAPSTRGLLLAIPIAANLGGIGTPIGTPPNAIALQYLAEPIDFLSWMAFAVPLVLVLLLAAWRLLLKWYPPTGLGLCLTLSSRFVRTPRAWLLYVTFALTLLLWLTSFWHGMNSYVVAVIPLVVFSLTGILTPADLQKINWDVLWLVAGGIALGLALDQSGLARKLALALPLEHLGGGAILLCLLLVCFLLANVMSNTATANLLLPITAAVATGYQGMADIGLDTAVVLVALSCSLGMILPVSTPPNALAYATGLIATRDLLRTGLAVGLLGLALLLAVMLVLGALA